MNKRLSLATAVLVITSCFVSSRVSAESCKPDYVSQDKITKQSTVKWQQDMNEIGFWKSMLVTDINLWVSVGRYGNVNAINIEVVKIENDRDRASMDSRFRAAKGDTFIFGLKGADPLVFTATEVNNTAKIEEAKGLVMNAILSAHVSDKDLLLFKNALTNNQIEAVRINLVSGQVERSVNDKNGKSMLRKFSCFYQYLDSQGIKLSATADQQLEAPSGGVGSAQDANQQLDLVVEDILAQDKLTLQALMHHDMTYLEKHIADDAIFTSNGKQRTKRMLLAQAMEQQEPPKPVKSRYSAVSSKTTGDIVEVTATATLSIQAGASWKDFYETRETTKYRKVNGEWVMLGGTTLYQKPLK